MHSAWMYCTGQDTGSACLPSCLALDKQQSDARAGQQLLQEEMQKAVAMLQHALQQQYVDDHYATAETG